MSKDGLMKLSKTAIALGLACTFQGTIFGDTISDSATTSSPKPRVKVIPYIPTGLEAETVTNESPVGIEDGNAIAPSASVTNKAPSSSCTAGSLSCDEDFTLGRNANKSCCDANACDSLFGCNTSSKCKREPWHLLPHSPYGLNIGGFSSLGYYTSPTVGTLNILPGHLRLEQQWLYAEKVADGRDGLGFGGRIDYIYGSHGQFLQASGKGTNHWDNSWDNGFPYGHALPQAYGEAAYGDFSVKVGYFLKIMGFESARSVENFFYSRQLSFVFTPQTQTGVLTKYRLSSDTTLLNGYVLGTSSAFEDNGDAYIGGISHNLTEDINLAYTTTLGRISSTYFGIGIQQSGQLHSLVSTFALTNCLKFVNESNYYRFDFDSVATGTILANTSYLFYDLTDRLSAGSRTEWFNVKSVAADSSDIYTQTLGVNYRPGTNLNLRPEVRWIWDRAPLGINPNFATSNAVFGMDAIFVF